MTQQDITSFDPAENARCRAYVLQAIKYASEHPEEYKEGITYIEIRVWIQENRRFIMENVGGRVKELARDWAKIGYSAPLARIEYDGSGRVHVYRAGE